MPFYTFRVFFRPIFLLSYSDHFFMVQLGFDIFPKTEYSFYILEWGNILTHSLRKKILYFWSLFHLNQYFIISENIANYKSLEEKYLDLDSRLTEYIKSAGKFMNDFIIFLILLPMDQYVSVVRFENCVNYQLLHTMQKHLPTNITIIEVRMWHIKIRFHNCDVLFPSWYCFTSCFV